MLAGCAANNVSLCWCPLCTDSKGFRQPHWAESEADAHQAFYWKPPHGQPGSSIAAPGIRSPSPGMALLYSLLGPSGLPLTPAWQV